MCRKHDYHVYHVDEVRYSGGMVDALAIFAGGVCPEVAIKEKGRSDSGYFFGRMKQSCLNLYKNLCIILLY